MHGPRVSTLDLLAVGEIVERVTVPIRAAHLLIDCSLCGALLARAARRRPRYFTAAAGARVGGGWINR